MINFLFTFFRLYKITKALRKKPAFPARFILCDPIYHPEKGFGLASLLSAFALCQKNKAKPIFLYEKKYNKKELNNVFCICFRPFKCMSVEELVSKSEEENVKIKIQNENLKKSIFNWTYKKIKLGRCLWDEIIWNKNYTVENEDQSIPEKEKLYKYIAATEKIISQFNLVAGFFTHTSGVASGVPMRLLLDKNVRIYTSYGSIRNFQPIKYEDKNGHVTVPGSITKKEFIKWGKNPKIVKEALNYTDVIKSKKNKKTKKEKIACWLVALHVFSDTPNTFNQHIFRDYFEWYKKTLELIAKIKKVHWVIRPHPHSALYKGDLGIEKIKADIKNQKHISLWNKFKQARDKTLIFDEKFADFDGVVTCSGTIAIQFLALGKPAITCADGYFKNLEILKPRKTLISYKKALQACSSGAWKIDIQKSRLARIAYYLVFKKKTNSLTIKPNFKFEDLDIRKLTPENFAW